MEVGVQRRAPALYPPQIDQVHIIQAVGGAPGLVWIDAESFASTGIRSPDRPAGGESLYRLSCRGPRDAVLGKGNIPTLGFCLRRRSSSSPERGFLFLRNKEQCSWGQ
jgi:hypothetical protein